MESRKPFRVILLSFTQVGRNKKKLSLNKVSTTIDVNFYRPSILESNFEFLHVCRISFRIFWSVQPDFGEFWNIFTYRFRNNCKQRMDVLSLVLLQFNVE